ncbi:MAG TPA: pyruvate kinase [Myxococcaceae bacterium]|jgi:pyruvate kinase
MRKAKIICTLGPASSSRPVLEAMIRAGMDVARLNFSHGTHDEHRRRLDLIRTLSRKLRRPVAILQDLQGPKIRLGLFEGGQLMVQRGQGVTVTTRAVLGRGGVIPTPVKSLPRDVRRGDPILLDDGRVRLEVLSVRGPDVRARVVVGGLLKDKKGLNLPGANVSVPSLTAKDEEDLAFGLELGVDYVALSFVRSVKDVERAREKMGDRKRPIIAKIEKPQAVANLEEIARAADGVMIARGDLGVEMPLKEVPLIQKQAILTVNRMGGVVIVATEMLESMIQNPRPTRAEVSDVANAVLDGADAVMLSGETAAGQHPVRAVETMAEVVEAAETRAPHGITYSPFEARSEDISTGVAAAAVAAARQLGVETIVAYTESGYTARLISEYRPRARIVGLTPNKETLPQMALFWGVTGMQVKRVHSTDAMIRQVRHLCLEERLCAAGRPVVIVTGVPLNHPGKTNMMTVHRI